MGNSWKVDSVILFGLTNELFRNTSLVNICHKFVASYHIANNLVHNWHALRWCNLLLM